MKLLYCALFEVFLFRDLLHLGYIHNNLLFESMNFNTATQKRVEHGNQPVQTLK